MRISYRNRVDADALPVAKPLALKYRERDEHLLRRLGAALVIHWDALPDELQDLLIDQAVAVQDGAEAPHAHADVETFLRNTKTMPVQPKAPDAAG